MDECSQQAGAGSRGQEKAVAVMVVVAVVVVVVMVVVVDRLSNLYNKLSMSNFFCWTNCLICLTNHQCIDLESTII